MLDLLTDKFSSLASRLKLKKRLTRAIIEESLKEVRLALLEADVSLKAVKEFTAQLKEKAYKKEVLEGVTPGDFFIKLVHDHLIALIEDESIKNKPLTARLKLKPPTQLSVVLFSGLQGAGKTTTLAKIAKQYREKRAVLTASLDVHRPAAAQQLAVLSEQAGVTYYDRGAERDLKKIVKSAFAFAKRAVKNLLFFDTAGRGQVDEALLEELRQLVKWTAPDENIFVCDAMAGQQALRAAESFKAAVPLNGVVFTKFDADTKGGAVLSVKSVLSVPIKFVGIGEKLEELDTFDAQRIVERILGMGDVVGLVRKAEAAFDKKQTLALEQKLKNKAFDLEDFLLQLKQMRKLGSIESLVSLLPGFSKQIDKNKLNEEEFVRLEAVINSMTKMERAKPFMLSNRRKLRIARGSGTNIGAVNQALKKFNQVKVMMKKAQNPKQMKKMLAKMGGGDLSPEQLEKNMGSFS